MFGDIKGQSIESMTLKGHIESKVMLSPGHVRNQKKSQSQKLSNQLKCDAVANSVRSEQAENKTINIFSKFFFKTDYEQLSLDKYNKRIKFEKKSGLQQIQRLLVKMETKSKRLQCEFQYNRPMLEND